MKKNVEKQQHKTVKMATSNTDRLQGINFKDALAILSVRASQQKQQQDEVEATANEDSKRLGQILDVGEDFDFDGVDDLQNQEENIGSREQKSASLTNSRNSLIAQEIHSMSLDEQIQAILTAQQERVKTYRYYTRYGCVTSSA
jgi:hypothetical protein